LLEIAIGSQNQIEKKLDFCVKSIPLSHFEIVKIIGFELFFLKKSIIS
jgi:hypothetical protein